MSDMERDGYEYDEPEDERRDNADLVAAALGLRSSAWAKSVIHLTKPRFNFAINGEIKTDEGSDG